MGAPGRRSKTRLWVTLPHRLDEAARRRFASAGWLESSANQMSKPTARAPALSSAAMRRAY
jgi:hypothetical protein